MIRAAWLPLSLGLVMIALAIAIVALGDLTHNIPVFLVLFFAMFVAYVAALWLLWRARTQGRALLVAIFAVAALTRIVFCFASPSLSTDIYRYLWEGRVVANGYNPFDLAPDADALVHLRDDNYASINHPHLATIYPPVAQYVFLAGATVWPSLTMQKILFVLFDLATLLLLMAILRGRGRSPSHAVVYGWSPLVALEVAHSGHMDSIGIFFLMLSVWLFEKRRAVGGVIALGLSVLAKFFALALLPFFVMKRRHAGVLALLVVVVALGYLPFLGAGSRLFASLHEYGTNWYFNSVAYTLLVGLLSNTDAIRLGLLAVLGVFALYQARRQDDVIRYTFLVIACALLLTPTVYPWYITWIVPFLCFFPSLGWIAFSGLVVASYAVWPVYHETGDWVATAPLLAVQYVPFFVLLIVDVRRRRRIVGRHPA